MNMQAIKGLAVVGLAGAAMGIEPRELTPDVGVVLEAGYIYYNVGTGEKVTTVIGVGDEQRGVDGNAGDEIWVARTGAQCAEFGYDTEYFFDLNQDDSCSGTSCTANYMLLDWGDIAMDTVVDCVQIHWITDHDDTDLDSDGIADGVDGFAGTWTYWDAINLAPLAVVECVSAPIISIEFISLPGEFPPTADGLARWTADIDLGGSFGTSLIFEIGDTDSDLQGAAVHNPRFDLQDYDSNSVPDNDWNENGLADWGWSVLFIEPGTADVDNADGDSDWSTGIDGVYSFESVNGIHFGSPTPGHAEYDSVENLWVWVGDGPTAGLTDDAFIVGLRWFPDGSGGIQLNGPWWFGGLDCSEGQEFGYTPAAHFETVLYGPGGVCGVDLNQDGVLDFFDVSYFLNNRVNYNGDGVFDFFDVSLYLAAFAAGCS